MCGKPWEQLSPTRHPMRCEITLNFCNGGDNVCWPIALRCKADGDFPHRLAAGFSVWPLTVCIPGLDIESCIDFGRDGALEENRLRGIRLNRRLGLRPMPDMRPRLKRAGFARSLWFLQKKKPPRFRGGFDVSGKISWIRRPVWRCASRARPRRHCQSLRERNRQDPGTCKVR